MSEYVTQGATLECTYGKTLSKLLTREVSASHKDRKQLKNGMIEWEKKYSNNGYYEIDDDQVKSLGTWKYYNEEGELVKTEEYGENGELVKTKIYGLNN